MRIGRDDRTLAESNRSTHLQSELNCECISFPIMCGCDFGGKDFPNRLTHSAAKHLCGNRYHKIPIKFSNPEIMHVFNFHCS